MDRDIDILNYLPPILANTEEQKQIAKAINPELELIQQEIKKIENNSCISSSDEESIKRREEALKIVAKNTETLEERKFRLIAREMEKIPYTYRAIYQKLVNLCGVGNFEFTVDNANYIAAVVTYLNSEMMNNEIIEILEKVIPLNMIFNILNKYIYKFKKKIYLGSTVINKINYTLTGDSIKKYEAAGNMFEGAKEKIKINYTLA